jgi:hypothetical protein
VSQNARRNELVNFVHLRGTDKHSYEYFYNYSALRSHSLTYQDATDYDFLSQGKRLIFGTSCVVRCSDRDRYSR